MSKQTEEHFDIYDSNMKWIGTAPRSEVHAKGYWHQTFQCWIVSFEHKEPALLLQLRHPDKDLFPNLLDISCAGHLAAGETVEDGVRELEEELGLSVAFNDLTACGVFAEEDLISEKLMDREFCHLFVYRCDQRLIDYVIQPEEVSGLFSVKVEDFESLIDQRFQTIEASGVLLQTEVQYEQVIRSIQLTDLVPHPKAYYEAVIQAVKDLIMYEEKSKSN